MNEIKIMKQSWLFEKKPANKAYLFVSSNKLKVLPYVFFLYFCDYLTLFLGIVDEKDCKYFMFNDAWHIFSQ